MWTQTHPAKWRNHEGVTASRDIHAREERSSAICCRYATRTILSPPGVRRGSSVALTAPFKVGARAV